MGRVQSGSPVRMVRVGSLAAEPAPGLTRQAQRGVQACPQRDPFAAFITKVLFTCPGQTHFMWNSVENVY